MTMIEKVGMAIVRDDGCGLMVGGELVFCDDESAPSEVRQSACRCKSAARAAIEAMREPTRDVFLAGATARHSQACDGGYGVVGHLNAETAWKAMIDAALQSADPPMTMSPSDRTRFDALRAEKQYALDCLHAANGEIERLLNNLNSRDDFLGSIGQWEAYVATLPQPSRRNEQTQTTPAEK